LLSTVSALDGVGKRGTIVATHRISTGTIVTLALLIGFRGAPDGEVAQSTGAPSFLQECYGIPSDRIYAHN